MKPPAPEILTTSPRWWAVVACAAAIAGTYVYFLIFAEFAFLEFAAVSLTPAQMEPLMGALGGGGIVGSVLAATFFRAPRGQRHLAVGFAASLVTALFTLSAHSAAALTASATLIGLSLGWSTVTLALTLRPTLGSKILAPTIGAGTGLAYALCNQPVVFTQTPRAQIAFAAGAAALGLVSAFWVRVSPALSHASDETPSAVAHAPRARTSSASATTAASASPFPEAARWIAAFFALVFLDSLAFYLIQHNPVLKTETWSSAVVLQGNALTHLAVAILAGFALRRFRPAPVVLAALLFLVAACALLNSDSPPFALARSLYVAGVSIYSTALVFIPAQYSRPWFAAAFMAIAGWIGSGAALGLALHQMSPHVPTWTLVFALVVGLAALAGPLLSNRSKNLPRSAALLVLLAVFILPTPPARAETASDPLVAAGRRVYIAEGCIHCHSQYIRPGTPDVLLWGPAHPLAEVLAAEPPLLGNRRQGPDLANVANRRSPEWNRLHLIAPRTVSPGSRMPSYAYLFRGDDSRGEALLAYLDSLGADTLPARLETIARWQPSAPSSLTAPPHTQKLFQQLCASCHGPTGRADGPLSAQLSIPPPDFTTSTWRRFPSPPDDTTLARLIKFGLPGSPMAGHEALPDTDILSLAAYVKSLHAQRVAP